MNQPVPDHAPTPPTPPPARHRPTLSAHTARSVACQALTEQAERFPDLLAMDLPVQRLAQRDGALAHAIYDTGIQRWLTLAYLFEKLLGKSWAIVLPPLRGALLAGGAQLLFMDRVPAYAAINESVEWAKRTVSPGGAGLVNAGLRSLSRLIHESESNPVRALADTYDPNAEQIPLPDGRAVILRTKGQILPTEALARLAVATSHPRSLLEAWSLAHAPEVVRAFALHSLCDAPIILNTAHHSPANPPDLVPHEAAGSAVFVGPHTGLSPLLGAHASLWVQDPSSSEAVASVSDLRPSLILDLCAGQGTKTRQLAHTFPGTRIIATDTDAGRLRTLNEVARSLPTVEVIDAGDAAANFAGRADLVLLDVPCSNTGVLARRQEARYRTATDQQARLVALQREILTTGASLLAPSGTLLYATCSIDAAENDQQATWAAQHLNLTLHSQRRTLPKGQPGSPPTGYTDGSFSARLTRP